MTDGMSIRIEGLDVLERRLKEIDRRTAAKAVRKALRVAIRPVTKEAKRRVRKRTGKLKKGIRAKVSVTKARGAKAEVGYDKKTFWGLFVEVGTSRLPARPFLRPALDTKKDEAVGIFGDKLKAEIDAVTGLL